MKQTYTLEIYTLESTETFDTKDKAESEQEYLERVQGKICSIKTDWEEDEEEKEKENKESVRIKRRE